MKSLRIISFVFMALGIMLFFIGIISKIQHWPNMFKGEISGLLIACFGIVLFIITLIKRQEKK
jgi:hypothetical protein